MQSMPRTRIDLVTDHARAFRPDIEGLRALAIIPVLLFHAHDFLSPATSGPLGLFSQALSWVPGGYLGVDVFFVISGFLITGLLVREAEETGRIDFGRFYARRARRILPAATLTLLVTLAASLIIFPAERAESTAIDAVWAALFNSDIHFANTGVDYMGVATEPSPILHFWSLNDEEKFYVVWPVLLLAATLIARRFARKHLRTTLFIALLALAVPSLLWSQHLVTIGDTSAYFSALSRAFELAVGGLLAIAMPQVLRAPPTTRAVGAVVGFAVIVWCMATQSTLTPFPGVNALPVVLGTALVLAGHESGVIARLLSTRVPRWFGRISFSLYLWHWPVFVLGAALTAGGLLTPRQTLFAMALSVLLGWISYRLIEQPPQQLAALRRPRNALAFGLALILITVVGGGGTSRVAAAEVARQYALVTEGITPTTKSDTSLLYIGDSITNRGLVPLEQALGAANWDFTIDALGGRPIISGERSDWTPNCLKEPMCGADLVLQSRPIPGTVVISLGSNSFNLETVQVRPPTATNSGRVNRVDAAGRYIVAGGDSAAAFGESVTTIMSLVPSPTTVYWIGIWLDDAKWGNVAWRENNAAMKAAVARYPNARFLDYAEYVDSAQVPYMPDGSHPNPKGMGMRANWIVSQLP
jgi:peptidoglycan/LPS O-acetylase OafA/YrhL